jgi:hypothetical protein
MLRLLRFLLRIPAPLVTREEALTIALRYAESEGGGVKNPRIEERLRTWKVHLMPDYRPGWWLSVDNQSGQIVQVFAPPR